MGVWHRLIRHLVIGSISLGTVVTGARADALYSVTNLGPANPSTAFLSGTSQLDPSGNYLNALSSADRATFQAGSFDVFAHPVTVSNSPVINPDYAYLDGVPYVGPNAGWYQGLVTSNNIGGYAGTESVWNPHIEGGPTSRLVTYTADPHTVHPQPFGFPNETGGWQATGYPSMVWTNDDAKFGQFYGTASGLNDKGLILINEWTLIGPYGQQVWTPYIQGSNAHGANQAIVPLGSLGGPYGFASALNNANQVVGWSQIASGAQHPFL